MSRYQPSLMDRLVDDGEGRGAGTLHRSVALSELKASVARDVEHLLNARHAIAEEDLQGLPHVSRSVVTFGLRDFSMMSLANPHDRETICRRMEAAIACHEPRLKSVQVGLAESGEGGSKFRFTIEAMLVVDPAREPVSFSALLQPSTQQYSVGMSK